TRRPRCCSPWWSVDPGCSRRGGHVRPGWRACCCRRCSTRSRGGHAHGRAPATVRAGTGRAMNPDLPSAVTALLRYGPRLAALADYLRAGPADDVVLVDRTGALTRRGLSAAVDAARDPSGAPLRRVAGRHDRTPLVAALAAALDGADVLVVHPATPTDEAVPAVGTPRGRLWLGTSGTTRVPQVSARPRYGPGLLRPVRHVWRRWGLADDIGPVLVQPPLHHGYGLGMALAALVARRTVLLPSGGEGLGTMLTEHR